MNLPTRQYSAVLAVQENIGLIAMHIFYQTFLLGQTARLLLIQVVIAECAEAVNCVAAEGKVGATDKSLSRSGENKQGLIQIYQPLKERNYE